jgi:Dolichyl-phosphate-mannose-protein mannosyltransferase
MTDEAAVAGPRRVAPLVAVRAVPVWAWLIGLVVVSTLIRYALSRRAVAPWIMIDELIYSELTKSFAATGHFMIRDHPSNIYTYVYPVLISPAWAIFKSVPEAYAAAKAINALVMSLAAVPAYFLARRVLGVWPSLAAAALAVSVPSMVYTATLMTENAFYPIFLTVVLAFVLWLEQPTFVRTALLAGLCLVAFLTRTEAIAFAPAILTTPLLLCGRRAFDRYRLMYGAAAVGALIVVLVQAARGASLLSLLGAYEIAGSSNYTVGSVTRWFIYHVAELDLSLGVVPFAALLVLALGSRGLPGPQRIFVVASAVLSFWLVLEVAIFASEQSFRVEERNMFYVAPLFLICLLLWIDRGLPRGTVAATAAIVVAAALPGALPYSSLVGLNAISDTIALIPLGSLVEWGLSLSDVGLVVVCGSIAAALLFAFVPRRYALVLPLLVLVYFAVSQHAIEDKFRQESLLSLFGGISAPHRNWVDRAVPANARVAAIWTGNTDKFTIWENEIFNRSVGTIFTTGTALPGDLDETPLTVDRKTGYVRTRGGVPIRARYALTDGSMALQGKVIAEDVGRGMLLYRVNGPLRQVSRVEGLWPDTWSKRTVTYTRLGCKGGTLAVQLQSDENLFAVPNRVTASVGGANVGSVDVPPVGTRILRVPLHAAQGNCVTRFDVARVAVPAKVASNSSDTRVLGVHFNSFRYSPPASGGN